MILATQAAAEYAALAMQRAASTLGHYAGRTQAFVSQHFLAVVCGLVGVVFLLTFLTSAGRRR